MNFTLNQPATSPLPVLTDELDYGAPPREGVDPTQFELYEYLRLTGTSVDYAYQGTVLINGETFIVTFIPQGNVYTLWGNVADPATFDPGTSWNASDIDDGSVNPSTVCFAAGTLIATPQAERPVETLQIGDRILTADGRTVPVKWIGRQTVVGLFAGDRARPVRVAAGALGDGLPRTDLVLTADHALILDGLAINAGALVNGTTIAFDPAPERATYYHIETEDHDVILANGAAAETFVDYVGRQAFDNYAEYVEFYGDERIITEMPLPRISTARLVPPALRKRVAGDAAA
ncbi:Hint domain-containing protein [Roseibacterium sp. KMU-115]|uniref:Hint domain-containing protein n=1 Tax=Roseicyclus persicicus TaxID=2650661 RepID=A0A7X6H0Q7_9RHOB|nr:Hint domain-containing protein [Roseibacterium persicicum]